MAVTNSVLMAVWWMERRRLATIAVSVLSVMLLKDIITTPLAASMWSKVLVLQVGVVLTKLTGMHGVLQVTTAWLRVSAGLRSLAVERLLRGKDGQSDTTGDSAAPLSIVMKRLKSHFDSLREFFIAQSYFLVAVMQLAGSWLALESFVTRGSGTITIVVCVLVSLCLAGIRRIQTQAVSTWQRSHIHTIRVMNEYLYAVLSFKLFAWEDKLVERVMNARTQQDTTQRRVLVAQILNRCSAWAAQRLSVVLVVLVSWSFLDASPTMVLSVFLLAARVSAALHDGGRTLLYLSPALQSAQALYSLLQDDKVEESPRQSRETRVIKWDRVVVQRNATSVFRSESIVINRGDLVLVHGPAGSGKSTLLRALLGEGTIIGQARGIPPHWTVAYCAQDHWLQNLTIRDNILFGTAFDEHKYLCVLEACGLLDDLQSFTYSDESLVESHATNLSVGQKARVALARSCYADADVYLLDCTLDAVDPLVLHEVFDKCIRRLLRHKTVILVSQNPELVSCDCADVLISMAEGTAKCTRTGSLSKDNTSRRVEQGSWRVHSRQRGKFTSTCDLELWPVRQDRLGRPNIKSSLIDIEEHASLKQGQHSSWKLILHLFRAAGFSALLMITTSALLARTDLWIVAVSDDSRTEGTYLGLLSMATLAMLLLHTIVALAAIKFSTQLFHELADALAHASLAWFGEQPCGELLQRLWDDVKRGDIAWHLFGHFVSIGLADVLIHRYHSRDHWWVFVLAMAMVAFEVYRQTRCNDQTTKYTASLAAINSIHEDWCVEVLAGVSVIRALGWVHQDRFLEQYQQIVDEHTQCRHASRKYQCRTAALDSLRHASLNILVLWTLQWQQLESLALGLLFCRVLQLPESLALVGSGIEGLRSITQSISRVHETATLATANAEATESSLQLTSQWPATGEVCFDHVDFAYPSQHVHRHPVLHDVCFHLRGGEKVGLIGRTGSGKSSVALALFRIHDLTRGCISVDGVDISQLAPRNLRRRLSIIPQSPVFYRCSVREYLDPFHQFDDAVLWRALHTAGLTVVSSGSQHARVVHLDSLMAENGANWSAGERQLLSLARAVIAPSRVLVLDEAFSSLEQARDDTVLDVVHREFAASTVLLITHRMDQVINMDRIMIMHDGQVVETGGVEQLLANPHSRFYELLEASQLVP
ncbi:TPA: LOW QUALITY PROTEIN: hypothetical protein N0F65_001722 [Lagenidium giganteum]|uniref:ABC transporter n=1 Tax=Lagenidium giganteum TaxID=4803 RepID=A0AAV2Z6S2_9STRA|nr:TPA: LOW QUALITY PROTEIN: hypothetical protein N0F65_001722 [Lagenidium giganteum]